MNRRQIDADLPILEFYLEHVMEQMEVRTTRTQRKVPRRELLTTFIRTRDVQATARAFGVSDSLVYQLVGSAIYRAKRLAGLWPPPSFDEDSSESEEDQ